MMDCSVASNSSLSKLDTPALDGKDFDTEGKIGACVSTSGLLRVFDIRTRQPVFSQTQPFGLNCCTIVDDGNTVLAGSDDGHIVTLDLRYPNQQPTSKYVYNGSITKVSRCGRWYSTSDGACFWNTEDQTVELTGPDCDPINGVVSSAEGKKIFTACRDGKVRQYNILH